MTYKLSSFWVAHEKPVRAVACTPQGTIFTASRDSTLVQWEGSREFPYYKRFMTYNAHQHYVSTCYFCPPNDTYQKGLIISGSNDKVVYVFELGKVEPLYTLCGHTDAICCIACGNYAEKLFIATASWDTTIKVWENGLCRATLSSHTAAVWCCCFVDSTRLWSGSADKTIKVWALTRNSQKLVATLEGHTDAVRGLVFLPTTSTRHVASCSNDASIMIWSTQTYECLKVLSGHNNYIYSICRLNAGSGFVTCGEDKTLKFWRNFECVQTITVPVESMWSVVCINFEENEAQHQNFTALRTGDIVVGCSDGIVRIFSAVPSRYASPELLEKFEEEVSKLTVDERLIDSSLKKEHLSAPEELNTNGICDGQQKLIRRPTGKIELYTWFSSHSTWQYVGEVVGVPKQSFQGREYDFVFDIDVGKGMPLCKLPYNLSDDPWDSAKKFVAEHNLSLAYTEQIVNFIKKNSGYSNSLKNQSGVSFHEETPFHSLFFLKDYLYFQKAQLPAIIKKIAEFNTLVSDMLKLSKHQLASLDTCCEDLTSRQVVQYDVLSTLMKWPCKYRFPVIDLLRCTALSAEGSRTLATTDLLPHIIDSLPVLSESDERCLVLALRFLANCFKHEELRKICAENSLKFLQLLSLIHSKDDATLLSLSTVLLNYTILMKEWNTTSPQLPPMCFQILLELVKVENLSSESFYRSCIALGILVFHNKSVIKTLDAAELIGYIRPYTESNVKKVADASEALLSLLL